MQRVRALGRGRGQGLLTGALVAFGGDDALRRALTSGLRVAALTALNMAAGEAIFGLFCLFALARVWLLAVSMWLRNPHAKTPVAVY